MAFRARTTAGLALIASLLGPVAAHTASAQSANPDPHRVEANVDPDSRAFPDQPRINKWRAKHAETCLQADERPNSAGEQYQDQLRAFLVQSPLMAQMYEDLSGTDVTICSGDRRFAWSSEFTYRPNEDMVILPERHGPEFTAVEAIKNIRRAWHDQRGAYGNDIQTMSKQGALADMLLREAEVSAFAVGVAYELKEAGQPQLWHYMSHGYETRQLAERYQQVMIAMDEVAPAPAGGVSATGAALRETFHEWFHSPAAQRQVNEHYADLVQDLPNSSQSVGRQVMRLAAHQSGLIEGDRSSGGPADPFLRSREFERVVEEANRLVPTVRPASAIRR